MTLTFYYDPASGPTRSVIVFLDFIKDTTIQRKYISILAGDQLKPDFIDNVHIQHTLPALKDEESGLVLYESTAILAYLAEKFNVTGKFGIPTEEKAKWQVINALHNQPHFIGKALCSIMSNILGPFFSGQPLDVDALRAGLEASKEKFAILDAILKKNGGFIAGSSPTVADLRAWGDLFQVSTLGGKSSLDIIDFSKEFPEIQKWLLALKNDLYSEETWSTFAHIFGTLAEEKFGGPVFRLALQ